MTACAVEISHPAISKCRPELVTIAAASGSTQKLNSASGVMFPGSTAVPPMVTTRLRAPTIAGSRRNASARLVKGPSVTSSTSPGEFMIASIIAWTPRWEAGSRLCSGRPISPMPSLPCT